MPGLAGGITCRDWQEKLHAGTGRKELRAGTSRRNYMPGLAGEITCRGGGW